MYMYLVVSVLSRAIHPLLEGYFANKKNAGIISFIFYIKSIRSFGSKIGSTHSLNF